MKKPPLSRHRSRKLASAHPLVVIVSRQVKGRQDRNRPFKWMVCITVHYTKGFHLAGLFCRGNMVKHCSKAEGQQSSRTDQRRLHSFMPS